MAWKERYSRSCCPPIFFDRKAWDGALACADVLLALVKEPCLQCLGLGLLVMLQGRYWSDQFSRVIGAQTDSAAPTGSLTLRPEIGSAAVRARVCRYGSNSVSSLSFQTKIIYA